MCELFRLDPDRLRFQGREGWYDTVEGLSLTTRVKDISIVRKVLSLHKFPDTSLIKGILSPSPIFVLER